MSNAAHRFDNEKRRRPDAHARQAMLTPPYLLEPVRVAVTISGVIAMGAQDESPAPAGHWLGEFWQFGRSAGQWRSTVWAVARALSCLPSTYADANGHVLKAAEKLTAERDELKAEVERLKAQLAERKDAARLDYLQQKQATVSLVPDGCDDHGTRFAFMVGGWHCSVNRDARASIDATIAASAA